MARRPTRSFTREASAAVGWSTGSGPAGDGELEGPLGVDAPSLEPVEVLRQLAGLRVAMSDVRDDLGGAHLARCQWCCARQVLADGDLQQVVPIEECESGQFRTVQVPDLDGLTEVLRAAHAITQVSELRFLDYSGADIALALERARDWLADVIPLRDGVERESFRRGASGSGRSIRAPDRLGTLVRA